MSKGPALVLPPTAGSIRVAHHRARNKRNSFEIMSYNGTNGGGKTMCAVFDSLPALAAGRPIVSTCKILDPFTGLPHPLWVPLDDFRLLMEVEHCVAILDEVTGVASSRDSAGLPSSVLNRSQQLRKLDVILKWTTPNWKRADTAIREVTKGITTCAGRMPTAELSVSEDGLVREWAPTRLFSWKTYDARNFDEWSTAKEKSPSKQHRIRPVARQIFWGPGELVRDCYDTYETALTLGVVSDAGMCLECGGKRRPRACGCPDPHEDDGLPPEVDGVCVACNRKRKRAITCDCHGEIDRRPSEGMLRWPAVHASRLPQRVVFEETDDTPAVMVETAA